MFTEDFVKDEEDNSSGNEDIDDDTVVLQVDDTLNTTSRAVRATRREASPEWITTDEEIDTQIPAYEGPEHPPCQDLKDPFSYFKVFIDDDLLKAIVEQTNF